MSVHSVSSFHTMLSRCSLFDGDNIAADLDLTLNQTKRMHLDQQNPNGWGGWKWWAKIHIYYKQESVIIGRFGAFHHSTTTVRHSFYCFSFICCDSLEKKMSFPLSAEGHRQFAVLFHNSPTRNFTITFLCRWCDNMQMSHSVPRQVLVSLSLAANYNWVQSAEWAYMLNASQL